ncbi:MAG: DNA replication/repair protein RecF [Acidimicrobiales bacterium]
MYLEHLWLTEFRNYRDVELVPAPEGITVISGANGEGKTNLLEAIAYLATLRSMRGSPPEALVRNGAGVAGAVIRAEARREGRRLLIEAQLQPGGRDRARVNGLPLRSSADLLGALHATVFSPDDLALVKGGPQGRRDYLDGVLAALHPRHQATLVEVERVLRQRNALLKSSGAGPRRPGGGPGRGRPDVPAEVASTLDVWDHKLATSGEALASAREQLGADLAAGVSYAYGYLARAVAHRGRAEVGLRYRRSWQGSLAGALAASRADDLRRGVTTIGPQRDDLDLYVGDLPARTHASQGEQRSLALALRLGGHHLVAGEAGSTPILLLDDVFSELDADRSDALLACLPSGQAILTTAGEAPPGAVVAARVRVEEGKVLGQS